MTACGGGRTDGWAEPGAAGTVFLREGGDRPGAGVVTIDNNARVTGSRTHIPPVVDTVPDELRDSTVTAIDYGAVAATTNTTIGDILVYTNCTWTLGTGILYVDSQEHWLDHPTRRGPGATNRVDHYEQIIWIGPPPGTLLLVK
jgi:hypothetical protein